MEVFIQGLGAYYSDTYYVAKIGEYKKPTVTFERFCYDLISLFGINLLYIELQEMELILRKLFQNVTFNFNNKVLLREVNDVDEAFTELDL